MSSLPFLTVGLCLYYHILQFKQLSYFVFLRFRMNHSSPLNENPDPNQANQCVKVFVQRDYSDGTMIKFQNRFPPELEDKVRKELFHL